MINCPFKNKQPRWVRRKEARPHELLDAALDLFVERGYAATRLDDVAARAGVSKGTLYLYFANKEELFKAVIRENMVPALGEVEQAFDRYEGSTAELMQQMMESWWERVGNTKLSGIPKLMMAEAGNFPEIAKFYYDEVISRAHGMLGRALERGIARGEFRAVDVPQAVNVLVAPMLLLMMWKHSFCACGADTIEPQAYLNCFADLAMHGLLLPPAPSN
jgi:AcrR family transcriptional regulator